MDKLEQKLFEDLSNDKKVAPLKCKFIIREALESKEKSKKIKITKIIKTVATSCCGIILMTGITFAGTAIYNSIWKEPQKVDNYHYSVNKLTKEEKQRAISEEEAKNRAKEILEQFGFKNEIIKSAELYNSPVDYSLNWQIKTAKDIDVIMNATSTKEFMISNAKVVEKDIKDYRTTREEAEKTAKELCNKYGIDVSKYNYIGITNNLSDDERAYIWDVAFYKKYDETVNKYQKVHISFIPKINEIYKFIITDLPFDNNPIEITEEQAKQKVLETEKNIDTGYEIKNTYTNTDIAKMNGYAYTREKYYEQYYKQTHTPNYPIEDIIYHRTEEKVRNVYMVTVEYDIPEDDFDKIFDRFYTYQVDATTGEIIGGNHLYHYNKSSKSEYTIPKE